MYTTTKNKDGTVITNYYEPEAERKTVTKIPDGNGYSATTTLPDGSYITDKPGGTVISFTPSDGTTITEKKDGTWNIVFPKQYTKDGTWHINTYYNNGQAHNCCYTVTRNADGTVDKVTKG